MPEYDNTNRGVLFLNKDKKTEKHPDYSGKLDVDGDEFYIDGWVRATKDGKKFLSISVKRKDGAGGAAKPAKPAAAPVALDDDDIPF